MPGGPQTLKRPQFLCAAVTLREAPVFSRTASVFECVLIWSHFHRTNLDPSFSSVTKIKGVIPEHREERRQVRTQEGTSHVWRVGKVSQEQSPRFEVGKSTPVFCGRCKE